MNDTSARPPTHRRTLGRVWLEFLGSMNLAITLLVVVAVASVIGTVLQQNQPYTDYLIKFGPFWFDIFARLGLYDVYGTVWFIGILGFLVLSTSVCIYRQAPILWREITRLRTDVRLDSLRGFRHQAQWRWPHPSLGSVQAVVCELLHTQGYRWQIADHGDHRIVAATKGRFSRLGYLFTHAAIVVIGVGGLLDGNLWLNLKEWRGQLRVETRDLAARDIPPESRLAPDAIPAFRGNVRLPEGSAANFVFLRVRDGFVMQELPFAIELKEFQVAYYDTGQPKSFISQVRIHDQEHLGDQPLEATVRVNHPLTYRGYTLYQSDFGDGGSRLEMNAWPLMASRPEPLAVRGEVSTTLKAGGSSGALTVELDDFRLFNLMPEPDAQPGARKFRNFGPSFSFKLRDAAGQAREYFNYMAPVQMEGRWFFISGMRTRPGDPLAYLHIPADAKNSPERFLHFNARLHDPAKLRTLFEQPPAGGERVKLPEGFDRVRLNLIELVTEGGFNAIVERAKQVVPADRLQEATTLYLNIVRDSLAEVFVQVLREEGLAVEQGIGAREEAFFNDAVSALAALPNYGSPFYLQLTGFEQVEASGLQVTRSSGTVVVYVGFILLTMGVFIMFYTSYRRLWVWLADEGGATQLILAGTVNRRSAEFASEFAELVTALERRINLHP